MKKILYVTTVSRTINAFLIPHIEMLIDKGYKVDCACFIDKPMDKILISMGVNIYNIPFCRNPLDIRNLKAFVQLKSIQKKNKYDVVHVHTPVASIYGRLLKLRFPKIRTIYTAHGYHFYKGAPKRAWYIFYPIERLMTKFTDVTININREDYEITKNRLKPKKCFLINGVGIELKSYSGIELEKRNSGRMELKLKEDDFVILMIAELNENKNQLQLIRALEMLKNKYPRIKAICVGEGAKLSELKGETVKRGIEESIFFLGFRDDIAELINLSDIGILLSYREGLPRSIMEFMAQGKKVIGTKIRGTRDLIENEGIGNLVDLGDYEGTARAIEKYYLKENRNFHIPREIEKYEVGSILKDIEGVYDSLDSQSSYFIEKPLSM